MSEWSSTRANPLIDPALRVWHAEVSIYLFLGGLVAGIMVLLALRRLRRPADPATPTFTLAAWSAPLLLSFGMLLLWLDLENRWNAYRFYFIFRPATPMSWGAWILLLVYPVSLLFAWCETSAAARARWSLRWRALRVALRFEPWLQRQHRRLGMAQLGLGLLLGLYTGILLGTFAARPLWNSAALGPLFLVSGLSSAAAFLLLLRLAPDERHQIARLDVSLILVEIAIMALWFVSLATGGVHAQAAVRLFFGGDFTAAFWTLVVALGLVTPLGAAWIEHRHGTLPGRAAPLLVLTGALALRWIVVDAGQAAATVAQLGP